MVQRKGRSARSGDGPGKHGADRPAGNVSDADAGGNRPGPLALPADLGRALRYLDDAQLDRLVEAAAAEARRRGRQDGRTAGGGTRGKPAPVTPGQERLVLAALEAGLKPAAIAREFRLSRAQVDGVVAAAKQRRR